MLTIAISACLLGKPCRYDGKSKECAPLSALKDNENIRLIPVCPEVQGGLSIPHAPSEIVWEDAQNEQGETIKERRVVNSEGADVTSAFEQGAQNALTRAQGAGAKLAILKAKSPSCGSKTVYDGTFTGKLVEGQGIAAQLFQENDITVIDETDAQEMMQTILAQAQPVPSLTLKKTWGHFKTITHHKVEVAKLCFKIGLVKQGLTHDLSKYSPTEFWRGARFYQGFRSPNAAEREYYGYTQAWLHHKGRNRHHFEYWLDLSEDPGTCMKPAPMPARYVAEMFCDRVAASKTYKGAAYKNTDPLEYYQRGKDKIIMHSLTRQSLEKLLVTLANEGEEAAVCEAKKLLKHKQ